MKKVLLLFLAVITAFTSCISEDLGPDAPEVVPIQVSQTEFAVSADSGSYSVDVTSSYAWHATSSVDWITLHTVNAFPGDITLLFDVKRNSSTASRSGVITIACDDYNLSAEISVVQKAADAQFYVEFSNVTPGLANYVCTPVDNEMLYLLVSSQELGQYGVQGETPAELMKNYAEMLAMYGMLTGEADGWFVFKGANTEMPKEASRWSAEESVTVYAIGLSVTVGTEVNPDTGMPDVTVNYLTPAHAWEVPFLPYPTLTVPEDQLVQNVSSAAGEFVFDCVLENPVEGEEVMVSTEATWATASWADNKLTIAYEANPTAVARRAKIAVQYGWYTNPFEVTLVQEKDATAAAITLNITVKETHFNSIIVDVDCSDDTAWYALNTLAQPTDWETGAPVKVDWAQEVENLIGYPGSAVFLQGDQTNHVIKMNPSSYEWYGVNYYVFGFAVAMDEANAKPVAQIGEVSSVLTTVDISDMPKVEWNVEKSGLTWNENNERYEVKVVEKSTLVLYFNVTNPVADGLLTLNGTSLYDSYNVVDGEPVVDNAAGTITLKIDKFDTAKKYHHVNLTFKYTNAEGDTWGISTPSLRITQVEGSAGPAMITSVADLTAGEYYVAGKLASYTSGSNSYNWTDYPYHFWTGAVSAPGNTSSNSDLLTVNGNELMVLDPNMSSQDAAKGNPGMITLVAVDGKTNTYYVKSGDKYLYCAVASTNRRMQLGDTPTEWVFADHAKGGIDLTSNGVHLATAGATYNLIRNYKDSSAGSSHQHGLVFFKK